MQPIVELRHVSFGYGTQPVLEDISLCLRPGQFAALVGPSGAGKTTLLKLILGTQHPVRGELLLALRSSNDSARLRIGYIPQLETVDWNFPVTAEQVVLMGRVPRARRLAWPWPSREDRRRLGQVMAELGIGELSGRHIHDLSGGQQQRVFLARALIAEPDLLVLDEPTTGVDMRTAENVLHMLARLNRRGMTILMTTHDLNAAAAHVPWVICLNRRIVAQGSPEDVFTVHTLNETYQADMLVIRQDGMLFVQQKPHGHTRHELLADAESAEASVTAAEVPIWQNEY